MPACRLPPDVLRAWALALAAAALLAAAPAHPPRPMTAGSSGGASFDHSHQAWTAILQANVRDGFVDYAGLARAGRPALDRYLTALASPSGRFDGWTREERLAYWINAYNAFTVQLILDNHPLSSIRSIGWLPGSAFRRRFVPLGPDGREISLDDIEHQTLRPEFQDARIHFAIVCASKSCPDLRAEAYRANDVDAQLDDAARRFLSDAAKNSYDDVKNILWLSSVFDWFREDFERDAGSLDRYVGRYLPDRVAAALAERRPAIRFLDYDWSLNGKEVRVSGNGQLRRLLDGRFGEVIVCHTGLTELQ